MLGTLLLALAGSVAVNVLATRQTLETQLRLKNSDNAQALALALSQQHGDRELMSLLMSAQFDTGYYRQIRFASSDGGVLFEQSASDPALAGAAVVPWRCRSSPSPAGRRSPTAGARSARSTVVSQASYAYDDLWRSSVDSALWLAFAGVVGGLGRARRRARHPPAARRHGAAGAGADGRRLRHRARAAHARAGAPDAGHEPDGRRG